MDSTQTTLSTQHNTNGNPLHTQTTPQHETTQPSQNTLHQNRTNRPIHMERPKTTKLPHNIQRIHPTNNTPHRTHKPNENTKPRQLLHKHPKPHPRHNPHHSPHKQNNKPTGE
jgi:hypothetical protein